MEIKYLPIGHIGANCYFVTGEKGAVIVDPGEYLPELEGFLNDNSDKERLILLTHCHFDHIGGALELRRKTGVKIAIGEKEAASLLDGDINLSNRFYAGIEPFEADIKLKDGEKLAVGDLSFTVIETPGHTIGGVCYLLEDFLFSGDTLFFESVGRTDFPGGDWSVLSASIKKLLQLGENINVLSGHGEATTLGHEKHSNPYLE